MSPANDAEAYIAQYGATLTDAEKRYILAFGAPQFSPGPARQPYTPGLQIGDAPDDEDDEEDYDVMGDE